MTTFYAKERAKYGNLTGQVIVWPVEYTGTPDTNVNIKNLPAGFKSRGMRVRDDDQPIQPGDVQATFSSTQKLKEWINYSPETSIENGVKKFVNWYRTFYMI